MWKVGILTLSNSAKFRISKVKNLDNSKIADDVLEKELLNDLEEFEVVEEGRKSDGEKMDAEMDKEIDELLGN